MRAHKPRAGIPNLFPVPGDGEEHRKLFLAEFGIADQIAIVSIIQDVTEQVQAETKNRLPNGFPPEHAAGHDRYAAIHDRLLTLDREDFSCKHHRHPNGTTSYTAIETPNVRGLIRRLESRGQLQKNNPFWAGEHARQNDNQFDLEEFRHRLIVEITYGLSADRSDVAFVEARFPDGRGDYYAEAVDMLGALKTATFDVPMEDIGDARDASVKPKNPKTIKKHA